MEQHGILIVDDDPNIREVLSILLGSEGYTVDQAENGEVALEIIHRDNSIDLVILDIMMAGLPGGDVCAKIREMSPVPVLFLTAKSHDLDKVDAYTKGGDDYLVKPFVQTELLMKVKSLLRRYKEYQGKDLFENEIDRIGGNIIIDFKTRSAYKDNEQIKLTDKEYDILQFFMAHRGEVVENQQLYEGVWGEKYLPSAGNTIMVHVLNLRKKLEPNVNNPEIIRTVWGKGYSIE